MRRGAEVSRQRVSAHVEVTHVLAESGQSARETVIVQLHVIGSDASIDDALRHSAHELVVGQVEHADAAAARDAGVDTAASTPLSPRVRQGNERMMVSVQHTLHTSGRSGEERRARRVLFHVRLTLQLRV